MYKKKIEQENKQATADEHIKGVELANSNGLSRKFEQRPNEEISWLGFLMMACNDDDSS